MANSKTFQLTGCEYEIIDCTADDLPTSPDEMERFLVGDPVISDWEDLKTVRIGGKPLDDFVFGAESGRRQMNKYRIAMAECITCKQFECEVFAESEEAAIQKAKSDFVLQFPAYSSQFRVLLCSKLWS